jgi:hypothetical protein
MAKKQTVPYGVYATPESKEYPAIFKGTLDNPVKARIAVQKVESKFNTLTQCKPRLHAARAMLLASNRAKTSARKKNLSTEMRNKYLQVSKLFSDSAHKLFGKYDKVCRE